VAGCVIFNPQKTAIIKRKRKRSKRASFLISNIEANTSKHSDYPPKGEQPANARMRVRWLFPDY